MSWFKTPKQAPPAVTVYRQPGTRDDYEEKAEAPEDKPFTAASARALVEKAVKVKNMLVENKASALLKKQMPIIAAEASKGKTFHLFDLKGLDSDIEIETGSAVCRLFETFGYKAKYEYRGDRVHVTITW